MTPAEERVAERWLGILEMEAALRLERRDLRTRIHELTPHVTDANLAEHQAKGDALQYARIRSRTRNAEWWAWSRTSLLAEVAERGRILEAILPGDGA